jgi:hypothetical protein
MVTPVYELGWKDIDISDGQTGAVSIYTYFLM